jgi:addiction module HigA family antidote
MHHPPHPSLTIRDDVLPALGLNVTQAAEQLGVSRVAFSRMINARAAISPEMALRIEAWLDILPALVLTDAVIQELLRFFLWVLKLHQVNERNFSYRAF